MRGEPMTTTGPTNTAPTRARRSVRQLDHFLAEQVAAAEALVTERPAAAVLGHEAGAGSAALPIERFAAAIVTDALREQLSIELLYDQCFLAELWDPQLQTLERLAGAAADARERRHLLSAEELTRLRDVVDRQLKLNPAAERAYQQIVEHEETEAALRERMHRAIGAQLGGLRAKLTGGV